MPTPYLARLRVLAGRALHAFGYVERIGAELRRSCPRAARHEYVQSLKGARVRLT
jgi:hypothetical protein